MGQPDLVPELKQGELGPLITQEGLEQLQNKYVQSVRVRPLNSVSSRQLVSEADLALVWPWSGSGLALDPVAVWLVYITEWFPVRRSCNNINPRPRATSAVAKC